MRRPPSLGFCVHQGPTISHIRRPSDGRRAARSVVPGVLHCPTDGRWATAAGCDKKLITGDLLYRTSGVSSLGGPVSVVRCPVNMSVGVWFEWGTGDFPSLVPTLPVKLHCCLLTCLYPPVIRSQNCYLRISVGGRDGNVIFVSGVRDTMLPLCWRSCVLSFAFTQSLRSFSNSLSKFVYHLFTLACCLRLLSEGSCGSSALSLGSWTNAI